MITGNLAKLNLSKNVYLFATTAFPGIHKLFILTMIEFLFPREKVGYYLNDVFIIYILGYFTFVNWSTFIVAQMPKLPFTKRSLFFGKIYWASLAVVLFCSAILFGLYYLDIIESLFGSILFLFGYSFYQLWRFYFLANKTYEILFRADLISLFICLFALFVSLYYGIDILLFQGIVVVIVPVIMQLNKDDQPILNINIKFFKNFDWKIYKKAFTFSLINLATGGIALFFTPLSHQLLESDITTIIGFTTTLTTVVLLIPKSLSRHYIPQLVDTYRKNFKKSQTVFMKFVSYNNITIIITTTIGVMGALIYACITESKSTDFVIIFSLVFANNVVSQLALPASNYVVILNKHNNLLKLNAGTFLTYIFIFLIVYNLISNGFLIVIISIIIQIVSHIFRSFYLNKLCLSQNRS